MNFNKRSLLILGIILCIGLFFQGCVQNAVNNGKNEEKPKVEANNSSNSEQKSLFAYVGAGLKEPFTELAEMYEQKNGVKIEISFNNSGTLVSQAATAQKGDIFMPGGMPFVKKAEEKGLVGEVVGPIAFHVPVIVTPKENPAKIKSMEDLAKPDLKIVMPDREATPLGKTAFEIFEELKIADKVEKNIVSYIETAPKIIPGLLMSKADAAITEYSAAAKNQDKLEVIEIDPKINKIDNIPCATLKFTENEAEAKKFLDFIKTEGPKVFAKHGFKTEIIK